jgi:hypothetical protein
LLLKLSNLLLNMPIDIPRKLFLERIDLHLNILTEFVAHWCLFLFWLLHFLLLASELLNLGHFLIHVFHGLHVSILFLLQLHDFGFEEFIRPVEKRVFDFLLF